jgi:hypothetical protein
MIFSENRFTLFRIMLYRSLDSAGAAPMMARSIERDHHHDGSLSSHRTDKLRLA